MKIAALQQLQWSQLFCEEGLDQGENQRRFFVWQDQLPAFPQYDKFLVHGHPQIQLSRLSLKAARALGDLSENTEYSTAKRELRHLESRLRYLNKQLQYAEIVTPKNDHTIDLGTTVIIEFEDDHEQETYHIVGKQEADLAKQKISFDSPLGQALLHKTAGTTVTVEAPQSSYKVKIVKIEL